MTYVLVVYKYIHIAYGISKAFTETSKKGKLLILHRFLFKSYFTNTKLIQKL